MKTLIFSTLTYFGLNFFGRKNKNPKVKKYEDERKTYKEAVGAYKDWAKKYGKANKIPTAYVLAMIMQESAGDAGVFGDGGKSIGLMQIQRAALIDTGLDYDWNELTDAEKNIEVGTKYLGILQKDLKDLRLAIAAYNVGVGNVKNNKKREAGQAYLESVNKHREQILKYYFGL